MSTLEKYLQMLCSNVHTSHESDSARRQLYLDINTAQEEEHGGVAEAFDKLKSAILPVLVKGKCGTSCSDWGLLLCPDRVNSTCARSFPLSLALHVEP